MKTSNHAKKFGYGIIAAGIVLSFLFAVVPFYSHHKLVAGILITGILPYLVYGIIVVFVKNVLSNVVGIVILTVQAGLVYSIRFGGDFNYNNSIIYTVPLVLTLLLIPLVAVALYRLRHE